MNPGLAVHGKSACALSHVTWVVSTVPSSAVIDSLYCNTTSQMQQHFCTAACKSNLHCVSVDAGAVVDYDASMHLGCPGEKRFGCSECDKKFMRSDHLTKHLRTHRKTYNLPVVTIAGTHFEDANQSNRHLSSLTVIDGKPSIAASVRNIPCQKLQFVFIYKSL